MHTNLRRLLQPLFVFAIAIHVHAAETNPALVPVAEPIKQVGTSVIVTNWRDALASGGARSPEFGLTAASDTSNGVRFVTTKQPEHLYSLQAILLNEKEIKKGDVMLLRFAARSVRADRDTGSTKLKIGFSKNSPDWDSSFGSEVGVGAKWERFDIPFVSKNDFAPKTAKLFFMYGYPAQIAEVADIQLIQYPADVSVKSLPVSKRYADQFPPEVINAELERIAAMRSKLDAVVDPSPAKGRTIYVAVNGSASADGSEKYPMSLKAALAAVEPGETVLVGAGDYKDVNGFSIKKSGRADAWIKVKAASGSRPKLISSGWSGFEVRSVGYIEIEGLELAWVPNPNATAPVHGAGLAIMYAAHHVRMLNNVVHGFGTGGIISLDSDYLYADANVAYDNAKTSPYGGSCISFCRSFDADMDLGYHNVIRRNVCYDNELKVSTAENSGGNNKALTDGNGIIIDVFNRSRANPLKPHNEDRNGPLAAYHGRTLIENNLMYDNGGRGIHVFRSSNVDVINNTTYMNQKSADINGGEYTAIEASNVVFLNNIAYGRKEKRINSQDGSTKVIWKDNLFFNYSDVLWHEGMIDADPLFVAASLKAAPIGFQISAESPAAGRGIVNVAPKIDIKGQVRPPKGPIDIGAFQFAIPTPK